MLAAPLIAVTDLRKRRRPEDCSIVPSSRKMNRWHSTTLAAAVFLERSFRERHAMAGALRDLEVAVLAWRHFLEQVGRRPVDELDEKAVGERADDVQRELVHHVRRNGDLVRGGEAADAQRLAVAVGAAHV